MKWNYILNKYNDVFEFLSNEIHISTLGGMEKIYILNIVINEFQCNIVHYIGAHTFQQAIH
jgi:hypothetical protein